MHLTPKQTEAIKIIEQYEVTSQDIDTRYQEIKEKEGFAFSKYEENEIRDNYYLGWSDDL